MRKETSEALTTSSLNFPQAIMLGFVVEELPHLALLVVENLENPDFGGGRGRVL